MIHGWYHHNNPWTGPHVDNPHQLSPTQLSCAPVINFLNYSNFNQTIHLETELTLYGDLQPNSSCAAWVKTLRRSSTKNSSSASWVKPEVGVQPNSPPASRVEILVVSPNFSWAVQVNLMVQSHQTLLVQYELISYDGVHSNSSLQNLSMNHTLYNHIPL